MPFQETGGFVPFAVFGGTGGVNSVAASGGAPAPGAGGAGAGGTGGSGMSLGGQPDPGDPWPRCLNPNDVGSSVAYGMVDVYANRNFDLGERVPLTESVMVVAPAEDGIHFVCALTDPQGNYQLKGAGFGARWVTVLPQVSPSEVEPTLILVQMAGNVVTFPVLPRGAIDKVFAELGIVRDARRGQVLVLAVRGSTNGPGVADLAFDFPGATMAYQASGPWQRSALHTDSSGHAFAVNMPALAGYGSLVQPAFTMPADGRQTGSVRVAAGLTTLNWIGILN